MYCVKVSVQITSWITREIGNVEEAMKLITIQYLLGQDKLSQGGYCACVKSFYDKNCTVRSKL